jgi:hypothetical protein
MSRPPRGRRSTSKPIDQLIAEISQARKEWDALPLEERIKAGRGEKHEPVPKDAPSSFYIWQG